MDVYRSSKVIALALLILPASTFGYCSMPNTTTFIEVVVTSCEAKHEPRYQKGAIVIGQVYAEMEIETEGYNTGKDPNKWNIIRHSEPATREYFFFSDHEDPCFELTARAPLLMEESVACCDVVVEGSPPHPSCSRKILKYMSESLVEMGATSGDQQDVH